MKFCPFYYSSFKKWNAINVSQGTKIGELIYQLLMQILINLRDLVLRTENICSLMLPYIYIYIKLDVVAIHSVAYRT